MVYYRKQHMDILANLPMYFFLFLALYFEVFLMITFFENSEEIFNAHQNDGTSSINDFPTVTIIVPCWNEEKTLTKTVFSLLSLDYPKDKLKLMLVDDGSTDGTWKLMQQFASNSQIEIHTKTNGGKHTALNFALERVTSEYVGCLDADSFVDPIALKRIIATFIAKPSVACVTPAIKLYKPSTIVQRIQNAEYYVSVFIKKMMGLIGGIHVTPGPFSIFKREVFNIIGPYRKAHNTEDCEIALRMHKHDLIIENCHTAYVYTVGPRTLKALYKQRVRWTHGFLGNALDYRVLFFNRKHGHLAMFTLPTAIISLVGAIYLTIVSIYQFGVRGFERYEEMKSLNYHFRLPSFDIQWFFVNTQSVVFLALAIFVFTISIYLIGKKMAGEKMVPSIDLVYFVLFYGIISPLWIFKSVYNVIFSKKQAWR